MLKHRFVSLCLNAGLMVGKQSKNSQILTLLERLESVGAEPLLIRIGDTNDGTYPVYGSHTEAMGGSRAFIS